MSPYFQKCVRYGLSGRITLLQCSSVHSNGVDTECVIDDMDLSICSIVTVTGSTPALFSIMFSHGFSGTHLNPTVYS